MKTATPELIAFLNGLGPGDSLVKADLYSITLRGGTVVLRYTDADQPIQIGDDIWRPMLIERTATRISRGVQVDDMEITLRAGLETLVNGVPIIPFIRRRGLDGATVLVEKVFGSDWSNLVGTTIQFAGRVGPITDGSRSEATVHVSSWTELLNTSMPRNVYQASCLHTLYDSGCTLSKASFAVTGTVSSVTSAILFDTDLAAAAGVYDQGAISFTSGANSGIARTIKTHSAGGILHLVLALPAAPAPGDTFTVYPGCDRKMSTCSSKFSNLLHFRGMPFIPTVETSL